MPRRYELHSSISPEQFPDWLVEQADRWNDQVEDPEGYQSVVKVKWKDRRLRVGRTVTKKWNGWGKTAGAGHFWAGWSTGWYRNWSNPFWARLEPDGRGGSVLTGQFYLYWWTFAWYFIFWILVALAVAFGDFDAVEICIAIAVFAFYTVRDIPKTMRNLDRGDGPEHILLFLRNCLEEYENHDQAL